MEQGQNNDESTNWVDEAIKVAKTIRSFILGSVHYRFAAMLLTLGVILVAGGGLWDFLASALVEILGADRAITHDERSKVFAQIVGSSMIVSGVVIFFIGTNKSEKMTNKTASENAAEELMPFSIIECWGKNRAFSDEQEKWMSTNPKWETRFWEITKEVDLGHDERRKKLRTELLNKDHEN